MYHMDNWCKLTLVWVRCLDSQLRSGSGEISADTDIRPRINIVNHKPLPLLTWRCWKAKVNILAMSLTVANTFYYFLQHRFVTSSSCWRTHNPCWPYLQATDANLCSLLYFLNVKHSLVALSNTTVYKSCSVRVFYLWSSLSQKLLLMWAMQPI